jgi:hypothetical protein
MNGSVVPNPNDYKRAWKNESLFAFHRLAHDPQRVLAAVCLLALVGFILGCNIGYRIMLARFELGIAAFAHADNRGRGFFKRSASVGSP